MYLNQAKIIFYVLLNCKQWKESFNSDGAISTKPTTYLLPEIIEHKKKHDTHRKSKSQNVVILFNENKDINLTVIQSWQQRPYLVME